MQRPGDNKWSMTIFARDPDTGMAKWVYQMTPHDEWDYDGVNEMILADIQVNGQRGEGPRALRPQRLRLHAEPRDRRAAGGREVRPGGQLGDACRHADRPAAGGVSNTRPQANGEDKNSQEHLPRGARRQGPAAGRILAEDQPVLRADQPRLHGLRAVQGLVHRRPALSSARRCRCTRRRAQTTWATSSPGTPRTGKIAWSKPEPLLGLVGRARDGGRRRVLRHARRLPEGGRRQDGQGAVQASRPRPASSATSTPTRTTASSTSPC